MHELPLHGLLQTSHHISQQRRPCSQIWLMMRLTVILEKSGRPLLLTSSVSHLTSICPLCVPVHKASQLVQEKHHSQLRNQSGLLLWQHHHLSLPREGMAGCMLSLSEQVMTGQPQQNDPHISLHRVLRTTHLLDVAEAR